MKFVRNIVKNLEFASGKSRVALIIFNDEARTIFSLETYNKRAGVLRAIEDVDYKTGGTYTAEALRMMREDIFDPDRGDRPSAPNKVIFVTDGISNILPQKTIPEARKTRSSGIQVFAVGIGLKNMEELEAIATDGTSAFTLQSYHQLDNLTSTVLDRVCAHETTSNSYYLDEPRSFSGTFMQN